MLPWQEKDCTTMARKPISVELGTKQEAITQPGLDRRPASQRSRLPAPIAAKAIAVPVDERLGTDDVQNLKDRRKPAVKQRSVFVSLTRPWSLRRKAVN
jgi:hypothetical protein